MYLVGSLVLVALAGCGRFFVEREPWRREAEVACLKSGAVREGPNVVQVAPINGPGICGADFPLKVLAIGDTMALGFADVRPPAAIPHAAAVHMPPIVRNGPPLQSDYPRVHPAPVSLHGAGPGSPTTPVSSARTGISPPATLACPLVAAIDSWIAGRVQPAALRWFGQPVAEIKQISAYSCRGMNGQAGAPISEHAFGNALDIAAFTLADGRTITVREGWRGLPEEQGFLRDVHMAACEQFSTVLSPGSNIHHYDHIHVDLRRRQSGEGICNPEPVAGDVVAARATRQAARHLTTSPSPAEPWQRRDDPFAYRRDVTGSAGSRAISRVAPGED